MNETARDPRDQREEMAPADDVVAAESAEPARGLPPRDPPVVQLKKLADQRWFVLTLAFAMMMFLALPILWRSRGFSRWEKVWWTLAILLYSVVLLGLFTWVMVWSIGTIYEALAP